MKSLQNHLFLIECETRFPPPLIKIGIILQKSKSLKNQDLEMKLIITH